MEGLPFASNTRELYVPQLSPVSTVWMFHEEPFQAAYFSVLSSGVVKTTWGRLLASRASDTTPLGSSATSLLIQVAPLYVAHLMKRVLGPCDP
jgi:hypothetical protein